MLAEIQFVLFLYKIKCLAEYHLLERKNNFQKIKIYNIVSFTFFTKKICLSATKIYCIIIVSTKITFIKFIL